MPERLSACSADKVVQTIYSLNVTIEHTRHGLTINALDIIVMFLLEPSEGTVHRSANEIRTSPDSISCFIELRTDYENRFIFYGLTTYLWPRPPYSLGF